MPDPDATRRAAATGALLSQLLSTQPRYIRAWQVHGERQRGEINQRAVARVLALYLWDCGEVAETDTNLPRRLKNQIHRALTGQRITGRLLQHLIGAFDMDEEDQARLWTVFTGQASVDHTVRRPRAMVKRQWHRTVSLFENWHFDAGGRLTLRHTLQCIEAREDDVDSYLFNHEPEATQIQVVHGGHVGRHYEYGGGLVSDDIVLHEPLKAAERTAIEYRTSYASEFSPYEVRRPARGRSNNVTLTVHFTPRHAPRRVWRAAWADHYLGSPRWQEPIQVRSDTTASWCLDHIEQTVVGFRWEW